MYVSPGVLWGPAPLPQFLTAQLDENGFRPEDASRCARLIHEQPGTAAAAALFVDLGACKFLEGDVDGALAAWRHSMSSDHDAAAARALLNFGLVYEQLSLHQRALAVFSSVAARNVEPFGVAAAMAAARCQVACGDVEQAMETLARLAQHLMAQDPDAPELVEVLFALGEVAERAGRPDRAERAWRVAAASPVSDLGQDAAEHLINLLLDRGHGDALVDLLDQLGPRAQLTAAVGLHRSGHHDRAAAIVESLDGRDLVVADRFRLTDIRLRCGLVNEAIDELEALLGHGDPVVTLRASFVLGEVYCAHAMPDAAISMYERVVSCGDPYWSPKAALALGDLRHAAGDHVAADKLWQQAESSTLNLIKTQAMARRAGQPSSPSAPMEPAEDSATADRLTGAAQLADTDPSASPTDTRPHGNHAATTAPVPVAADAEDDAAARIEPIVVALDELESAESDRLERGQVAVGDVSAAAQTVDSQSVPEASAAAQTGDSQPGTWAQVVAPLDELDPVVVAVDEFESDDLEPIVVVLDEFESDDAGWSEPVMLDVQPAQHGVDGMSLAAGSTGGRQSTGADKPPSRPRPSAFASHVGPTAEADRTSNPYAALAPEGADTDDVSITHNPYAELAPNFDDQAYWPPSDVEPGDWESMLDDWPRDPRTPANAEQPKKKRPRTFSRYT